MPGTTKARLVEAFLAETADRAGLPLGRILAAAWRSALETAGEGHDPAPVRAALRELIR